MKKIGIGILIFIMVVAIGLGIYFWDSNKIIKDPEMELVKELANKTYGSENTNQNSHFYTLKQENDKIYFTMYFLEENPKASGSANYKVTNELTLQDHKVVSTKQIQYYYTKSDAKSGVLSKNQKVKGNTVITENSETFLGDTEEEAFHKIEQLTSIMKELDSNQLKKNS